MEDASVAEDIALPRGDGTPDDVVLPAISPPAVLDDSLSLDSLTASTSSNADKQPMNDVPMEDVQAGPAITTAGTSSGLDTGPAEEVLVQTRSGRTVKHPSQYHGQDDPMSDDSQDEYLKSKHWEKRIHGEAKSPSVAESEPDELADEVLSEDPETFEVKSGRGNVKKSKQKKRDTKGKGKERAGDVKGMGAEEAQAGPYDDAMEADPPGDQPKDLEGWMSELQTFIQSKEDELGDSKEESPSVRKGSLPKEAKETLDKVGGMLDSLFTVLSRTYGKPPEYLRRYLGYSVTNGRDFNTFNVFQRKYQTDKSTARGQNGMCVNFIPLIDTDTL